MAGPVTDRELNRSVRFAQASEADEAAIRRLLRENPMRGAVSVTFEREPGYFCGADLAGGEDRTIVAYEDDRLVCMGRCTERECWLHGQATQTGYLAELRLDSAARRRFAIVRDGYRFFREGQSDAIHFTSIASDNERARRFLENGARGMPIYSFLDELVTLLLAVPRRAPEPKLVGESPTTEEIPAMLRVLNEHGRRHQLAMVWTAERLRSLAQHGLPLERFHLAKEGGNIIACGALWDQRSFRQTVIQGYAGALAFSRKWVNVANRIVGRSLLPTPGNALAQAFLSPLAFAPGAESLLPEFVESFLPPARALGIEWLTVALPAGDARLAVLRKLFSTRAWPSRLYRVDWPEQRTFESFSSERRFLPDLAFL